MPTTNEQLQIADEAITHVLRRIHESPEVGYYMGYGTESFERLCAAYAAISDQKPDDVKENFLPIMAKDPCKELLQRIEDLERSNTGRHRYSDEDEQGDIGPEALTSDAFVERVKQLLGEHAGDANKCMQAIAALLDCTDVPISILTHR